MIPNEYAAYGKGDFRHPAYQVQDATGSRITELKYQGYTLSTGKKRLEILPSTFDDEGDRSEVLTITLKDDVIGLVVKLNYTVFPKQNVIVRNVEFINEGEDELKLLKAMSLQLDLPDDEFDFIHFSGAWLRERQLYRTALRPGLQSIDSLRYSTSPQNNPFFMLSRKNTTEESGEVYGFNLIYSGNFQNSVEVDHFSTTRVLVGLNPVEFEYLLEPKMSFMTPEAVMSYSAQGINALSQQLANFYQDHLVNPHFVKRPRPIVLNSWETMYFNLTTDKVLELARCGQQLGIELFVLDDGWFGHREGDDSSLGDWTTDYRRIPKGVSYIADEIHKMGMQFGLWFEPEMISIDSELYRTHPEWMICTPHRKPSVGRHQYVLDFTNQEVIDYLFDAISKMIDETKLEYIKWDYNRHITDAYTTTLPTTRQMEFGHRYILGVYQLLERLMKAHPEVLFESCSSGGGRFDLGMMYYAPQAWTSDDTDPIERLKIQHGTSYGYSLSMMSAHVSASPNEQSGRRTSLDTRAVVAYFGVFGYELDVTTLDAEEAEKVKEQIRFYKKYRDVFQYGNFYRIRSPFEDDAVDWQVVSKDQSTSILVHTSLTSHLNPGYSVVKFCGLDDGKRYTIAGMDEEFYGDELMNAGIRIVPEGAENGPVISTPEYQSHLLIVEEIKE
jgi:alpha-galactosidase